MRRKLKNSDLARAICNLLVVPGSDTRYAKREFLGRELFVKRHSPAWFDQPITEEDYNGALEAVREVLPEFKRWAGALLDAAAKAKGTKRANEV